MGAPCAEGLVSMNVVMLEYFTTASGTLLFLVKKEETEPVVFQLGQDGVTREDLLHCAERLILDFHGLPADWDSDAHYDHFKYLLSLPPAVNAGKRSKGLLQINLKKPVFAYELTYWQRFSDLLLPQEVKVHLADCDLLCIVPHGPLHSLPFAALRWSEDEYLIERFGICYAPSASVLQYCQQKNRRRNAELRHEPDSCLIVAVAAANDEEPQEFEADGDTLARLFHERDAHASVTALVGTRASGSTRPANKIALQQEAASYDVLHLACHGLFGLEGKSGDPLASGLLVSDGVASLALKEAQRFDVAELSTHFLTAREAFHLNLTADLVTLRACSSGRVEVQSGDELLGLTRAFLYAGATSLIVSLWNVHKQSSRFLLDEFYRLWLDKEHPLPKWQALQQAQKTLLRHPEYRHPYHWAPFILVGDWL